jgi:hypothetical protein
LKGKDGREGLVPRIFADGDGDRDRNCEGWKVFWKVERDVESGD